MELFWFGLLRWIYCIIILKRDNDLTILTYRGIDENEENILLNLNDSNKTIPIKYYPGEIFPLKCKTKKMPNNLAYHYFKIIVATKYALYLEEVTMEEYNKQIEKEKNRKLKDLGTQK